MPRPALKMHIITLDNGNSASVLLPDVYAGISGDVGITARTGSVSASPRTSVKALLMGGLAAKMNVSYMVGTRRRVARILCAADKLDSAPGSLPGKSFRESEIKTAYFPSRQRLS